MILTKKTLKSWWYKNCKVQRKRKALICNTCPFKKAIQKEEKLFKS
jgi:hypothetical protein